MKKFDMFCLVFGVVFVSAYVYVVPLSDYYSERADAESAEKCPYSTIPDKELNSDEIEKCSILFRNEIQMEAASGQLDPALAERMIQPQQTEEDSSTEFASK